MTRPLSSILAPALALGTEYYLFAAAGALSVCAFVGLILVPALGSYGRAWEKLVAGSSRSSCWRRWCWSGS